MPRGQKIGYYVHLNDSCKDAERQEIVKWITEHEGRVTMSSGRLVTAVMTEHVANNLKTHTLVRVVLCNEGK